MNKKPSQFIERLICYNAFLLGAFSSFLAHAESQVFHAKVKAYSTLQLTEAQALNFGEISPEPGALCKMDGVEQLQGNCNSHSAISSFGRITIEGLTTEQGIFVTVTGSSTSHIRFDAKFDVLGGASPLLDNGNGQSTTVVPISSEQGIEVIVYGDMRVLSSLELGSEHTASYEVEVNFQ